MTTNRTIEEEFHRIPPLALYLAEMSWKTSVSLCWSSGHHLNIFYSELSPRETLASQSLVDLLHNSVRQTILKWLNLTEDFTLMLFTAIYVIYSHWYSREVAWCIVDDYLQLLVYSDNFSTSSINYLSLSLGCHSIRIRESSLSVKW